MRSPVGVVDVVRLCPVAIPTTIQYREFRASPVVQKGRKTGHRATEPKSRTFSKKQIKRKLESREKDGRRFTMEHQKKKESDRQHVQKVVGSDEALQFAEATNAA
jgi:hypothetical protein